MPTCGPGPESKEGKSGSPRYPPTAQVRLCSRHLCMFRVGQSRGPGSRGREGRHCGTPKSWCPPPSPRASHAIRPADRAEFPGWPGYLMLVVEQGRATPTQGRKKSIWKTGRSLELSRCSVTGLNDEWSTVAARTTRGYDALGLGLHRLTV